MTLGQPYPVAVAQVEPGPRHRSGPGHHPARHPRRAGHAGRTARRRSGAGPQCDRPRGARRCPAGAGRCRVRHAAAPAAAGLGLHAGRPAARRSRGGPVGRGTRAAPPRRAVGRGAADRASPAVRATAVRCRSTGIRPIEVLAECSVDVFAVLPVGELWIAAARMRQVDRLRHVLDELFALLGRLGDPALWAVPLHWAGVHAGILSNSPEAVAPHGQALTAAAPHSPFARALATAGRTWLKVLANQVDVDDVTASSPRAHAVRPHLGRDPAGRAGRAPDRRPAHLPGHAAAGPRPEAHRRGGRAGHRSRQRIRGGDAIAPAARAPRRSTSVRSGARGGRTAPAGPALSGHRVRICSSRPRPSSITWPESGGGWAPNPAPSCSRCCAH